MNGISRFVLYALTCLACVFVRNSPPLAATAASNEKPIPLAHSALLTLDASEAGNSLVIHIKHASDQSPVNSKDVTVSIEGESGRLPVTPQGDGMYLVPIKDLPGEHTRMLDIVVGHDGIREILTGKLTFAQTATTERSANSSLLGEHKQMAWWILNVAVVLIAVLALSRRKGADTGEK